MKGFVSMVRQNADRLYTSAAAVSILPITLLIREYTTLPLWIARGSRESNSASGRTKQRSTFYRETLSCLADGIVAYRSRELDGIRWRRLDPTARFEQLLAEAAECDPLPSGDSG